MSLPPSVGTADMSAESDHMQDALEEAGVGGGRERSAILFPVGLLVLACGFCSVAPLLHADDSSASPAVIRQLQSRHIRLHTDVDSAQAMIRLRRMENVLSLASKYWGRPLPGKIEAYLVAHPDRWPADGFPLRQARIVLEQIGGATTVNRPSCGRHVKLQTCVYATTAAGIAEHETVHAYCLQTFGRSGPDWYSEGMAEVFASMSYDDTALCRAETRQLLHDADAISLRQILARSDFTRALHRSVKRLDSLPGKTTSKIAFDPAQWNQADQRTLDQTQRAYAESWALCHLLCGNPNYQADFRHLGRRLLAGHSVVFEQAMRPMLSEIDFELERMREHLADGYRVDLCRWPWEAEFSRLEVDASVSLRVSARAGFQATRILVIPGQEYRVRSAGRWSLRPGGEPLDGDGDASGWGNLQSGILDGFCLNAPIDLKQEGAFVPRNAGKLYLRCHDRWDELADNQGELLVRLTRIR